LPDPALGQKVFFVGFGSSDGLLPSDTGLKRFGRSVTVGCPTVPESTHVCTEYVEPVGPAGEDSSTCAGDSGGPLLTGDRESPVLIGVASGALDLVCRPPHGSYFTELSVDLPWLAATAGADLGADRCSDLPVVGGPEVAVLHDEDELDFDDAGRDVSFEVPAGTRELRVGVNGEAYQGNVDLYLRAGAAASVSEADCAGERGGPFELCRVDSPEPGTWHARVQRVEGALRFQVTATLFGSASPEDDPPPPPGAWLTSPDLPGYRVKARVRASGGAAVTAGRAEPCIAETLCLSGALAGRPEVFVKVIGPRPNGFLWVQISRFTPSEVEIWVEQVATGSVRYYRLDAVGREASDVSGLQDREAFLPI
jgi:hypothetical protein